MPVHGRCLLCSPWWHRCRPSPSWCSAARPSQPAKPNSTPCAWQRTRRAAKRRQKALNEDLQKRYYEHLYAILLPIINAKRTSNGHIDLNEKSWQLIEENTDLVLPRFTLQLRKNHPSLSDEDVRFCCLVAMRVPNPVIANIYGIASSSVAVRKQRMKRKLDESLVNETLETYLTHYGL